MDSERIIDLINPILAGSADYTKGDRLSLSGHYHNMPAVRLFGNRLLTWLTRVASGYWQLNDAQNGFTAISRPALEKVDAQLCAYYGYLNILLVKLSVSGARVFDVPMPSIYGSEKSAIRLWRYIPVVSLVIFRGLLWRMKVKLLRSDGRR